jgi:serine protease AprX
MNTMNTIALSDDIIASYSSKGPSFIDQIAKPDVVAPGNLVTSLRKGGSTIQKENPTFFTPHSFYVKNGNFDASPDYTPLSGTSMATGVVSGAVAVLLQAQPQLTPDAVKALLMFSAQRSYFPSISTAVDPVSGDRYFSHYDALTVGAGYVDLQATLANALNIAASIPSGTAMSPVVSYNPSTGDATLVTDQTALWGRTELWGAANVYGQNAFEPGISGSTALWGRTALWGADDPSGFTALWGATALWGRATPDAATALWGASSVSGQSSLNSVSITDAN